MSRIPSMRDNGFTLFEILITLFIFSVVVSVIFTAYSGAFRIMDETTGTAEVYDQARIALERMCEDLASLYVPGTETVAGKRREKDRILFSGEPSEAGDPAFDTLTFLSLAHIDFDRVPPVPQPAEIVYYVRQNDQGTPVLYRSDTPMFKEKPVEGTGGLPLCEGVAAIHFTYYDAQGGAHKRWDAAEGKSGRQIPSRVSISLTLKREWNPEAPLDFSTGVAIPVVKQK